MLQEEIQKLEKIGYRFVGKHKHSAIKICNWTRQSIRGKNFCYKEKFYKKLCGIESHRCVQMSPSVPFCTHKCLYCWRFIEITKPKWTGDFDEPSVIVDECIDAQRKILQGFSGSKTADRIKIYEAERPKHFAISLAGEPLLYPKISELIDEIKARKMTAFLVTNGTLPKILEHLSEPTQLYITLPAPNEETYKKACQHLIKNGWKKILESLSLLENFSCNTVIRLTLVRNLNFFHPELYAKIIDKANPDFCEVKGFMSVGASRERLPYSAMPLHTEIKEFAKKIAEVSGFNIKDEKSDSRVVLLSK